MHFSKMVAGMGSSSHDLRDISLIMFSISGWETGEKVSKGTPVKVGSGGHCLNGVSSSFFLRF